MSLVAKRAASQPTPTFLTLGFRPFFLAAGLWSATALALWMIMLTTAIELPSRFDPLTWHIHEMLFGFVMAAIAGFLLTAIPNWTQRLPVSGRLLGLLAGLWLLGRIACLGSALVTPWLAIAADLSFPVVLVGVVAHQIISGRNWRNLPMVVPASLLGIANLLMHLEADGVVTSSGLGWRLGLSGAIVMISVVAGRIVPSFTRNWIVKRQDSDLPALHGWIDRAALSTLHAGLFGWAFFPTARVIGALILLGAALNFWRLARCRDGRRAAAPDSSYRLRLGGDRCGLAWRVIARYRFTAKRRGSCVHRRRHRNNDSGRDDSRHARPYRARLVGRSRHGRNLHAGQSCRDRPGRRRFRRGLDDAATGRLGKPMDRRLSAVRLRLRMDAASSEERTPAPLNHDVPIRVHLYRRLENIAAGLNPRLEDCRRSVGERISVMPNSDGARPACWNPRCDVGLREDRQNRKPDGCPAPRHPLS